MADPENQTLRLLRELRAGQEELSRDLKSVEENLSNRIKTLQQAMIGESVLGRYTVAEVEERLDAFGLRLTALETK